MAAKSVQQLGWFHIFFLSGLFLGPSSLTLGLTLMGCEQENDKDGNLKNGARNKETSEKRAGCGLNRFSKAGAGSPLYFFARFPFRPRFFGDFPVFLRTPGAVEPIKRIPVASSFSC